MTVELVFFDPKMNDCSTTISVSRQLMEKAESLSGLKGQYEKEMKRIKTETQKVQTDLQKANAENRALENKIKKLNKLIAENQGYAKQIKTLEDFVESAKNERKQIKKKIENYIYRGMSYKEVSKIMQGHDYASNFKYGTICNQYESAYYTRYKDYILCGVKLPENSYDYGKGFVTKVCKVMTGSCYTREMSY